MDAPEIEPTTRSIEFDDTHRLRRLVGPRDAHLRQVERRLGVRIGARGSRVVVGGEPERVELAVRLLEELYALLETDYPLYPADVDQAAALVEQAEDVSLKDVFLDTVFVTNRGRVISPRGLGQKRYIDAIRKHDLVFGIGPAGTGKTYLAMAMAVAALVDKSVNRIILCRPAVEAGEKLGFLPGNLAEKVNPYLRPLYDALHDMMDDAKAHDLVERGTIEVAPLAFMRGRTLNDAFVILDEAQNTTNEQMKMFLTRLGFGSKAVVTGDITQIDLPDHRGSGLVAARAILEGVGGIAFRYFSQADVVRHPLVSRIIAAYETQETRQRRGGPRGPGSGAGSEPGATGPGGEGEREAGTGAPPWAEEPELPKADAADPDPASTDGGSDPEEPSNG